VFPVKYELNLYMLYRRKETASVVQWSEFLATERRYIVFPVRYELNLYMLCRRKETASVTVVTVPGYTTEMYCVSCGVRTELIYVM
jgi:hypothetical protein